MKTPFAAAILLILATNCHALEGTVTIFVTDSVLVPSPALAHAEMLASEILGTADVRLEFRTGVPKYAPPAAIVMNVRKGTSYTFKPGALAYAEPCGNRIVVLYDRIEAIRRGDTSDILGHVLAHEITHMLRGDTLHSATGLMKANWTYDDYFVMRGGRLPLSPDDIEQIHIGLALRKARALVSANTR